MSVNTMGFEQAASLLVAIQEQVTGKQVTVPVLNTSDFVSVAATTLQSGYEPVLHAITQVIAKTLVAVRPYSRKFKGLEYSSERWGGIIRKISFADHGPVNDPTYSLTSGSTVDQYSIMNPIVLETRYVGQNIYSGKYTIFTKQLDVAFSSPTEFASFMSGLMTHFSNEREQWLEDMSRAIMVNMIVGKKYLETEDAASMHVVHALTMYNGDTGKSLTATTVKAPENFPAFSKWLYAKIQVLSETMTERSKLFQRTIDGYDIMRHTPKEDQKFFLDAGFLATVSAEVLADTYHDSFLRYADVEPVNFWQNIFDPDIVKGKAVTVDDSGETVTTGDITVDRIIGVVMDRDAAGYNIADNSLETSPYNAAGQYYNIFSHVRIQLQNDFTEKAVLICLD